MVEKWGEKFEDCSILFNLTTFFTRAKRGNIRKEVSEKGPNPVTFEYVFFVRSIQL